MEVKFYVIRTANFDMILGKDFIGEFVETIHVQSKTVILRDKEGASGRNQVKINSVVVQKPVYHNSVVHKSVVHKPVTHKPVLY